MTYCVGTRSREDKDGFIVHAEEPGAEVHPHPVQLPKAGLDDRERDPVAEDDVVAVLDQLADAGGADEEADQDKGQVAQGQEGVPPQDPHHCGDGVFGILFGSYAVVRISIGFGAVFGILIGFGTMSRIRIGFDAVFRILVSSDTVFRKLVSPNTVFRILNGFGAMFRILTCFNVIIRIVICFNVMFGAVVGANAVLFPWLFRQWRRFHLRSRLFSHLTNPWAATTLSHPDTAAVVVI